MNRRHFWFFDSVLRKVASLTLASLFLSAAANAGQVLQVKGSKVLLDLSGMEEVQPGDDLFTVDGGGKKRAIIHIKQVKNGKAVAEVLKGTPVAGHELQLKGGASAAKSQDSEQQASNDEQPRKRTKRSKKGTGGGFGFLGSYNQLTMTGTLTLISPPTTDTVAMSGSGFGVLGYYDFPVSQSFVVRAMGGYETMNANGTTADGACGNGTTTSCTFAVSYLPAYGVIKWNFYMGSSLRAFAGGSYGFLVAASKSSTIVDTSAISTNQIFSALGGVDILLNGGRSYIPIIAEYGMFPSSNTVKASFLFLRGGYGWNF